MKRLAAALLPLGLLAVGAAHAQADAHAGHHTQATASSADAMTDGEVRKVDKDAGKITLKHGPIKSQTRLARRIDHYVRRLDVAMNHPRGMHGGQRPRDFEH